MLAFLYKVMHMPCHERSFPAASAEYENQSEAWVLMHRGCMHACFPPNHSRPCCHGRTSLKSISMQCVSPAKLSCSKLLEETPVSLNAQKIFLLPTLLLLMSNQATGCCRCYAIALVGTYHADNFHLLKSRPVVHRLFYVRHAAACGHLATQQASERIAPPAAAALRPTVTQLRERIRSRRKAKPPSLSAFD